MEQTKSALTSLEQAILKLETAVYSSKKTQAQLEEQVLELKHVLKTTYDRLTTAIETYRKEVE